jgi:hypothetical protein
LNQLSFIKIKFDSTQYDFKTLNNTNIAGYSPGNYIGMINKTSGLPSGFGRYMYSSYSVWDGQFYEGKFHGVSRRLLSNYVYY